MYVDMYVYDQECCFVFECLPSSPTISSTSNESSNRIETLNRAEKREYRIVVSRIFLLSVFIRRVLY